jgi:hypothetical protein
MDRNILIVFIVILSLYVLYRLFFRRWSWKANDIEAFSSKSSTVNSLSTSNTMKLTLSSFTSENLTAKNSIVKPGIALQLRNYCIKGSFNSAYNGSTMDAEMIAYVLSRGCRFLDFEVYYSDKGPIVSMSDDPTSPSTDSIPLSDAFDSVMMNGFNSNCPNPDDPIFILIRPKMKDEFKAGMYESMATVISHKLYNLYSGRVTPTTSVEDLMGSVVIVFDKTRDIDYAARSRGLAEVVNMETASGDVAISSYTGFGGAAVMMPPVKVQESMDNMDPSATPSATLEPTPEPTEAPVISPKVGVNSDGYTVNVSNINIVLPTNYAMVSTTKGIDRAMMANPDFFPLILKGAQIILMEFWSNDMYLNNYEAMFNQYGNKFSETSDVGKAVLPLSVAISFANMNSTYGAVVAYP